MHGRPSLRQELPSRGFSRLSPHTRLNGRASEQKSCRRCRSIMRGIMTDLKNVTPCFGPAVSGPDVAFRPIGEGRSVFRRGGAYAPMRVAMHRTRSRGSQEAIHVRTGRSGKRVPPHTHRSPATRRVTFLRSVAKLVLGRPIRAPAGRMFDYHGGKTPIIAGALERSSGMGCEI
jgi:hypothetical protein